MSFKNAKKTGNKIGNGLGCLFTSLQLEPGCPTLTFKMTVALGSSTNGNASQWMDKEGNINCKRPVLFRKKEIHDSCSCGVVKSMKREGDSKNNVEEGKRFGYSLVAYVDYNLLLRTLLPDPD